MSYLGAEPSSIPLINRGAAEVNNPTAAAPYQPSVMLQDFLNSLPGSTAPKPLVVQPGGGSYTPTARGPANSKILLLLGAAAGMWWALGVGGRGRSVW